MYTFKLVGAWGSSSTSCPAAFVAMTNQCSCCRMSLPLRISSPVGSGSAPSSTVASGIGFPRHDVQFEFLGRP